MRAVTFLSLTAIVAIALAAPSTDAQRSRGQSFGEAVEVLTVEIPVLVRDRDGNPVKGLTAADFEVQDGRDSVPITGFQVVDLSATGDAAGARGSRALQQLPIGGRRHFLFLFDLSFSEPSAISRARKAAIDLVKTQLHPSDVVAVATYSIQRGPEMVLGFTSDQLQIELALKTLGLPSMIERFSDPLAFVITDPRGDLSATEILSSAGDDLSPTAQAGSGQFAGELADYAIGFDRSDLAQAQGQVLGFTRQIEELAKVLHSVRGRKYVVFLSEGFDSQILTGSADLASIRETNEASASGQFWEVDSEERYGSTGALSALDSMLEELRRADAVIQAVDLAGLRGGSASGQSGQNSLFTMAKETGGELFRNWNDLSGAMEQMLDRTSVTYLLSIQPRNLKADGEFHRLRVRVKGQPRGTDVAHRTGYYAPRPYAEQSAMERRLAAADHILGGDDEGSIETAVVAAPIAGAAGDVYVPVLIEMSGPSLLKVTSGKVLSLEVYAYAIDDEGRVRDFFSQAMGLDLEKVRPVLEQGGVKLFGDLTLPAGDYLLRTLVRDTQSGRTGSRSVPLSVPVTGGGEPTLAAPLFADPPNKWMVVQETTGAEKRRQRPYPFMRDEQAYVPSARPEVATNGEARFTLLAYNLGTDAIPLEVQVVTAAGEPVEGPEVSFVGRDPSSTGSATALVLTVKPNGLAPGEYRMVASLKGVEGAHATSSIPFVVSGG